MKKLTKSMKVVLISVVSAVCVAGIVLGCVFGFRKPNEKEDIKYFDNFVPVEEKNLTWAEQVELLGMEMLNKNNKPVNEYARVQAVPYSN